MKSALLVVDVQHALCVGADAAFEADRVISKINEVIARARAVNAPVIFIQHESPGGALSYNTAGWQLASGLSTRTTDLYIRKSGPDSFHNTALHDTLHGLGIGHLVIGGLQSEFCVDSTVRRALALGYPVTLVADGHSTMDSAVLNASAISAHHNHTLVNLASYGPRATPVPASEIELRE